MESTCENVLSLQRFDSQKSSSDCHPRDKRQTPLLLLSKCYSVNQRNRIENTVKCIKYKLVHMTIFRIRMLFN